MKYLTLTFCFVLVLISCRKDDKIELISDVPDQFETVIHVYYHHSLNYTRVYANFLFQDDVYSYPKGLKLSENSFFTVNGIDLVWQSERYIHELVNKPACFFKFQDDDGNLYENYLLPPDTVFLLIFRTLFFQIRI